MIQGSGGAGDGPVLIVTKRFSWDDDKAEAIMTTFSYNGRDPGYARSEHTQRALRAAERRREAGARTAFLVKSMVVVLAGVVLAGLASWALLRRLMLVSLLAALCVTAGCTSAQVAEADIYKALVVADEGVTWAAGHEAEIRAAITVAMAVDPKNATLQSAGSKALVAIDNGDLGSAMGFVRSTRIVFSPSPVPIAPPAAPGQ